MNWLMLAPNAAAPVTTRAVDVRAAAYLSGSGALSSFMAAGEVTVYLYLGTVECLCADVLISLRQDRSETRLPPDAWFTTLVTRNPVTPSNVIAMHCTAKAGALIVGSSGARFLG